MQTHLCPLCATTPVIHQERYPRAICLACSDKACDRQGRRLRFFNLSGGGGFGAQVAHTGEEHSSHVCYIEEVTCWADEARFGGIVIQPHDGNPFKPVP